MSNRKHHFVVKTTASGQYMSRFNYNSEAIVWSEELSSKANALANISSVKKNACVAPIVDLTKGESASGYRIEVFKTTDNQFMVRFKAPNNETVVVSERYTAKHNAIKAAESVRNNTADAPVIDIKSLRAA